MQLRQKVMTASINSLAQTLWGIRLRKLPLVTVSSILSRKHLIRLDGSYSYVEGSLPWCDLTALITILVDRRPRSVLEIGTFNGHTTRMMALNLPGSTIHTIDLPPGRGEGGLLKDDAHLIESRLVGIEYRSDPEITNVKQHLGDTANYPFPQAECVFIDGAHTYEYVRNDTKKALSIPGVKTLIWHDCDRAHPGVIRWLLEMANSSVGVPKRIDGTNLAVFDLKNGRG